MGDGAGSPLTPDQNRALRLINASILEGTPTAIKRAAEMILRLFDPAGNEVFLSILKISALNWCRQFVLLQRQHEDLDHGAARWLYRLTQEWTGDHHLFVESVLTDHPFDRPKMRPSLPPRISKTPITDEEVAAFRELLDREGVKRVFTPGMRVEAGQLIETPLITLGTVPVPYATIASMYEFRKIQRTWDESKRQPEIALGLDLILLAASIEKKWTHFVADRYFCGGLPRWHRYNRARGRRPAWRNGTGKLEKMGLMEHDHGRTWRLSGKGERVASEQITPIWCDAARPRGPET